MESLPKAQSLKRHSIWLVIAFSAFFCVFRMAVPTGWDEAFYMAQLSSGLLDGDLMLQNDILEFDNSVHERIRGARLLNRHGDHLNAFSIGPALFYSIPVMLAYTIDPTRFGSGFQQAIALWTALFWFLGLAGLYQILSLLEIDISSRYLGIFAAVCSTPFILYGTRFYLTAHFLSAVIVIFCIYFWIHWLKTGSYLSAWAAGLSSGFLVITRWESGVFFLAYMGPLLWALRHVSDRRKRLIGLVLAIGAGLLVLAVQLSAWKLQFGQWLLMPQEPGFMLWSRPALWKFFISGYHGMLPWSPGIVIGFAGLVWCGFRIREPLVKWMIPGLIAVMLIQYYTSAATWDWWGGSSYGPRRFTLLLGPVAMGWALLLNRLPKPVRFVPVIVVVAWAGFTMCAFRWQVDDLTLLLTGKPDIYRPDQDPVTPDKIANRWNHFKYGYEHMRVPGFALKNQPRPPHRRSGCIILLLVFGGGELIRRLLLGKRRVRQGTLLGLTLYVLLVVILFNSVFVRNTDWRDHWQSVVQGQAVELPVVYPRGYDSAVSVLETVTWLEQSQVNGQVDQTKLYDNSIPGLTLEGIIDSVKNAR